MAQASRSPLSMTDKVVVALLPCSALAFAWAILAEHEAFVAMTALLLVSCAVLSLRAFSSDPTPHHVYRHSVRHHRPDRPEARRRASAGLPRSGRCGR